MKEETRYLWISELPPNATQKKLTDLFSSYGRILSTKIHEAGQLRGAVLSFLDTKTAVKACTGIHLLDGQSLTSEYCDQSGEPGLQRLKDSACVKFDKLPVLENGSSTTTSVNNNNSPPSSASKSCGRRDDGSPTAALNESTAVDIDNRSRTLKICNLPDRLSDASLQSGLYHEFRRLGRILGVQLHGGILEDRYATTTPSALWKLRALASNYCGANLSVKRAADSAHVASPHQQQQQQPPAQADDSTSSSTLLLTQSPDEYHPRATRTLFVGNLDPKTVWETDLRDALSRFGNVLKPKLGFGRSPPTECLWLGNLSENVSESFLSKTFSTYGRVRNVCLNFNRLRALVYFHHSDEAQKALMEMKNRYLCGRKLQADFASQKCQRDFMEDLARTGGKSRSGYKIFEQLYPPEFDRGAVHGRSGSSGGGGSAGGRGGSKGRYRSDMVITDDYVKSNHKSWRKFRDHHYESSGDHFRRQDEFSSPYSDQSYADDYLPGGGRGGPQSSRSSSSRRQHGGGGGSSRRQQHQHGYNRHQPGATSSPSGSGSQKGGGGRGWRHSSRSPTSHHGGAKHSADSSTSSSPVRPALGSGDLRSLLERSNSRLASNSSRRRRSASKGSGGGGERATSSSGRRGLASVATLAVSTASSLVASNISVGAASLVASTATVSHPPATTASIASSSAAVASSVAAAANAAAAAVAAAVAAGRSSTQDMSLRKLEQEKQMLLAQLANLEDARSDSSADSVAGSDAENSSRKKRHRTGSGSTGTPRRQRRGHAVESRHSADSVATAASATAFSACASASVDAAIKEIRRETEAASASASASSIDEQQRRTANGCPSSSSPSAAAPDAQPPPRDPRLQQQQQPATSSSKAGATDQKQVMLRLLQDLVSRSRSTDLVTPSAG
uniref:RRM domain-containing protein n=1 Tax=Macrostomum lignano TaxID=282301 RepID=A0A1I8JA63_9PLAT